MRVVVLDTETSGLDPAEGAALLEVAWVVLSDESGGWQRVSCDAHYVRYDGAIPPQAKAVHHIRESDVDAQSGAVERDALIHSLLTAEELGEMTYAAHNASFDFKFLHELTLPKICTYRCSMHLWPDSPSHSNQTLRYLLAAEPPAGALIGLHPHRALYDAEVTAAVLLHMLRTSTPQQLLELTARPVLLHTVKFGQYRGKLWTDVPKDYLSWLNRKSDMVRDDADLRYTVRHHLGLSA